MSHQQPKVTFYNNGNEKLALLQEELDETKDILNLNMEKLLMRGEELEKLQDSAEHLVLVSQDFRSRSTAVKRQFWWEKYKLPLIVGSGVSGVVATLLWFI